MNDITEQWFLIEYYDNLGNINKIFKDKSEIYSTIINLTKKEPRYAFTIYPLDLSNTINNVINIKREHYHFGDYDIDGIYNGTNIDRSLFELKKDYNLFG